MTNQENIDQGNTSLKAIVGAIFRHRRAFTITALTVLALTAAYTLLTPKTYQSEMNILVRNARGNYIVSPERSNGVMPQSEVTEERLNSEVEVLTSKDIADVAVDPAWLSVPLKDRSDSEIHEHDLAIAKFHKKLNVDLIHKSDVIHVTYQDRSPRRANEILGRVLSAFLAKQRQIDQPNGTAAFFTRQAEQAKAELDAAQEQLATAQQDQQMVSLPDKESTLEQQITSLEDQRLGTDAQLSEVEGRLIASREKLEETPQRLATQQRSVPNNLSIEQLNVMLTELRNKRTELLTKYPPTERLVMEIDQKIATTSSAIENANQNQVHENSTDVNPLWHQMNSAVAQSATDVQALRTKRAHQQEQIDKLRANLSEIEASTVAFTTLQSKVSQLQTSYELYAQKRDEAHVGDAMDKEQLLNVAVVTPPTFSTTKVKPGYTLNAAMGLFSAVFLGVCVIFFAEMGRDTIASPQELEALSRYPVLATVPYMDGVKPPSELPPFLLEDRAGPTPWGSSPDGSPGMEEDESYQHPEATRAPRTMQREKFAGARRPADVAAPEPDRSLGWSNWPAAALPVAENPLVFAAAHAEINPIASTAMTTRVQAQQDTMHWPELRSLVSTMQQPQPAAATEATPRAWETVWEMPRANAAAETSAPVPVAAVEEAATAVATPKMTEAAAEIAVEVAIAEPIALQAEAEPVAPIIASEATQFPLPSVVPVEASAEVETQEMMATKPVHEQIAVAETVAEPMVAAEAAPEVEMIAASEPSAFAEIARRIHESQHEAQPFAAAMQPETHEPEVVHYDEAATLHVETAAQQMEAASIEEEAAPVETMQASTVMEAVAMDEEEIADPMVGSPVGPVAEHIRVEAPVEQAAAAMQDELEIQQDPQTTRAPRELPRAQTWSQRVLSSFGHRRSTAAIKRPVRKPEYERNVQDPAVRSVSGAKMPSAVYQPVRNSAEVVYDKNGKVEYVTYTFNPKEKK